MAISEPRIRAAIPWDLSGRNSIFHVPCVTIYEERYPLAMEKEGRVGSSTNVRDTTTCMSISALLEFIIDSRIRLDVGSGGRHSIHPLGRYSSWRYLLRASISTLLARRPNADITLPFTTGQCPLGR